MKRGPRRLTLALAVAAVMATHTACHSSRQAPATVDELSRAASGEERVDVIAKKCARIASCAHRHDAPLFRDPGACTEYWLEHLADVVDPVPACLGTAATCADIEHCLHGSGDERAATYCVAHPGVTTACDGDSLVTCARDDPGESRLTDCKSLGAGCGETRSPGGLVTRGCLSPSACAPEVSRSRCDDGGGVVACHEQILERTPCPSGTKCHAHRDEDGEEIATCEGAAEVDCQAIGTRSCRGATLVRCEAHGHHGREELIDCAAVGLTCAEVGGRAGCSAGGVACTTGAPRCEGDAVVFCAAGKTERVGCRELGLGPCEADGKGPIALCGAGAARPSRR